MEITEINLSLRNEEKLKAFVNFANMWRSKSLPNTGMLWSRKARIFLKID